MGYRDVLRWLVAGCAVLLCQAWPAEAGKMHLRWNASPGATGYRIYYGTASGAYTSSVTVGRTTTFTLSDLDDCTRYFVAIKAFNAAGEAVEFSNEISGQARPTIQRIFPTAALQGESLTLAVIGTNFDSGAILRWVHESLPRDRQGNPLIRFQNTRVLSCGRIEMTASLEPGARGARAAPIGEHDLRLELVNPDTTQGSSVETLEIAFAPWRADINRSDTMTRDRVDGQDLAWLAYAYGATEGAPRWNPDADLTGDGLVDGDDLALMAPSFGRCWSGTAWAASACR